MAEMHLDLLLLSRVQFALTIMFDYLFSPLATGLGVLLVIGESSWMITKRQYFGEMALFWSKRLAVNFAISLATGIVMEFQFGTIWATYS
jgi:cytochrome d ubiquinol oxidase subunit I